MVEGTAWFDSLFSINIILRRNKMKVGDIFKSRRNVLIIVGLAVIIIALGVFFFLSEEEPPAPYVPPRPRPAAGGANAPAPPQTGAQGTVEASAKAPAPPQTGAQGTVEASAKAPAPPQVSAKAPAPPQASAKTPKAKKSTQAPSVERATSKRSKRHLAKLSGKWAINTASFINKDEARKFMTALKKAGYNAYITTFFKDGENWNRVRVGFYNSKEEADRAADKISSKYDVSSPWVVMPSSNEVSKNSR